MRQRFAFLMSLMLCLLGQANAQVTIEADRATVVPNQAFCLDILVEDFTAITNFQFSVTWDPNIIRLDSLDNPNLDPWNDRLFTNPNLAPGGAVPIIWIDPLSIEGVTVEDGGHIFQMCFTAIGAPGQMSDVEFANLPLNMEIADVNSSGSNIGVNPIAGKVNIVAPYGFSNTQITDESCAALSSGAINISPFGAAPPYTYQWEGPSSFSANTEDISGLEQGTYSLTISDASQPPLVQVETFTVNGNFDAPIADAGDDARLDCNTDFITLNGQSSSMGPGITYQWQSVQGNILSGETTLMPTVNAGGTYILVVTDDNNGCSSESFVEVMMDTLSPIAEALAPNMLDCANDEINLSIGNSATGADISYTWTTLNGNIVSGANNADPLIDEPGLYFLEVSNSSNGCMATANVTVETDTLAPTAVANASGQIDCDNEEITLDGSGSSDGDDFSYQWTTSDGNIVSGANSLSPLIDKGGTYQLEVTNVQNSCVSTVAVNVGEDRELPTAVSSPDTTLTCLEREIFLSANGSSAGADITYTWLTEDGNILSGEDDVMPLIDASGNYQLVVTDLSNGCTASASVNVGNALPQDADAGGDISVCDGEAQLIGNIDTDLTGVWTTSSAAIIDEVDENMTMAFDLEDGNNVFVWTLSTPGCPDYDSDTIVITLETLPIANEDVLELPFGATNFPLDLTANDGILSVSDYTINVLSQPSGGTVESVGNGAVLFSSDAGFLGGSLLFDYELCNAVCIDFCDTAQVRLNVRENIDTTLQVANAITPNDDGVNDFFIIPEILEDPEEYPNSTLTVFNRWGDIVFKESPYLNNWSGQSENGGDLPEGTYYYIVQLKIGEATIYRGDVTILR
ncbi:MAG: gliding motility-associated C-terminal domain-containing protein [Bacteroidota bacterium]